MSTKLLSRGVRHILLLVLFAECAHMQEEGHILCTHLLTGQIKASSSDVSKPQLVMGELIDNNTTQKCSADSFCYSLWQEDFSGGNATELVAQGCWTSSQASSCSQRECIDNRTTVEKQMDALKKNSTVTMFCCCNGDFCNRNVSYVFSLAKATLYTDDTETVIIAVTIMCSLSVIILFTICFSYHMCSSSKKASPDSVCLMEPPLTTLPMFNIDDLKIAESIGRGRYGRVYRGTLYNQSVAVKIFSSQHRNNYLNERYIYCLPFMDHSCLPKLIGAEERKDKDEQPEYLLVLSYAPNGCLQEYLTANTIDWSTFCKMAQCITQGLAHLHMEIRKDDKVKMCIAHRDLTSRNVLVRADSSCMLCDFGFAICISGSKYCLNGEEQVAESTSLMEVGTLRYMAPEVLEGAVNLRDCESSLKQIDMYALGLILWELATRCSDLFQGVDVPEYKAPFAAEIGNHPSTEQLQHLVVKHKARPLFPDIWKDTNPAVRALKETIEDCWDQDAEARLTALCVEERLVELPILWDRYKAGSTIQGVSPTVNPTSINATQTSSTGWPMINTLSPSNWNLNSRYSGDFSVSENTAETSITISPSELTPSSNNNNLKNLANTNNNNIMGGLKVTMPLQPYQGKNPIMERNLVIQPDEAITFTGNSLVEREDKFSSRNNSNNSFVIDPDLFNTLQSRETSESNALVPNDVLSQSTRAVNPIPFVQNAVHVVSTIPKQPNVPGNGHSLQVATGSKASKKGIMTGFKNLFKSKGNLENPNVNVPSVPMVEPPTVIVPKLTNTVPKPLGVTNLTKRPSLDTEVYLMDPNNEYYMTQTIVRPVANRQVYSQTVPTESPDDADTERNRTPPIQNGFVPQSQTHPQLCLDGSLRMKRPNTLPIAVIGTFRTHEEANFASENLAIEDGASSSSKSEETTKLSDQSKNPRLSLYDDRIMTTTERLYHNIQNTPCKLGSPHISASVPLSIDILCESEVDNFHNTFKSQE